MSTVKKPDNWILLTLVLALLWLGCGPAGFLSQPSTPPPNDFPILTPAPADTAIPPEFDQVKAIALPLLSVTTAAT